MTKEDINKEDEIDESEIKNFIIWSLNRIAENDKDILDGFSINFDILSLDTPLPILEEEYKRVSSHVSKRIKERQDEFIRSISDFVSKFK